MRRALAHTVPRQILDRKRKAYVSRALVKVVGAEYARLRSPSPLRVEELGIVDCGELERAVHDAEQGRDVATVSLLRTLALEDWLRGLRNQAASISRDRISERRRHPSRAMFRPRASRPRKLRKEGGDTHELHEA